jgi:hypothetical protein
LLGVNSYTLKHLPTAIEPPGNQEEQRVREELQGIQVCNDILVGRQLGEMIEDEA